MVILTMYLRFKKKQKNESEVKMMLMSNVLVGKQYLCFDTKEGNHIEGVKLHFNCPDIDGRVDGLMVSTQFINVSSPLYNQAVNMPFGAFDFVYGPKGKVMKIIIPDGKKGE